MEKFLFVSRHEPTEEQHKLAAEQGIELEWHGDTDAFTVSPGFVDDKGAFVGVVVVHPAAALHLCSHFMVGVFRNENRAAIGEKPQFKAVEFHVWDLVT